MYNYNYQTELYHYGVVGMKWGVRRAAEGTAKGASKTYKAVKKHGDHVLERQAQRNDLRAQYHASRGHGFRARYYDWKAFKSRDSKYDDVKAVTAGIMDVNVKADAVAAAVVVGSVVAKNIINKHLRG